jgi:DNA-binding MarR family transcriptional regulator
MSLLDLANHLSRRGERLAATAGLTTQEWIVLLQVARDPNFPGSTKQDTLLASDIADARGMSRAYISNTLAALARKGLVADKPDKEDRRRRNLVITRAGIAALRSIEPTRRAANRVLLEPLSKRERETFLRHLDACLGVLWRLYEDEQVAARKKQRGIKGA